MIRAPQNVRICVFLMIFGAVVAAVNDLAFNLQGYLFVLLNDVCTAATGVMTKKKLNSNNIGKKSLKTHFFLALIVTRP